MADKKKRYFLIYTALFLIMCLLAYSWFIYTGRSLIWYHGGKIDGLTQHYTSLAYYGDYLREILHNIFIEHTFTIPTWDLKIGMGSDIITTLNYYVFGDPLALFSVFVPVKYTEYLYEFLIILRLYLAGLSFTYYCRYFRLDSYATLVGSFVYIFSLHTLFVGIRHPYFLNPMIYLPLLLIGIEKIFRKKPPFLFIAATCVSAASNFYFFYMMCIMMFIYAIFRYIMIFGKIRIPQLCEWLLRFVLFFLIGLGMASPVFIPNAASILSSSRLSVEHYLPLLYQGQYYAGFIGSFLGSQLSHSTMMGYSVITLPALYTLFVQKRRDKALKLGFLLLIAFLMVPYAGHVLNGFSYVTNRWIWALQFLVAFITAKKLPEIPLLSHSKKLGLCGCFVIYSCIVVFFSASRTKINLGMLISLWILLGIMILVRKKSYTSRWLQGGLLFAMAVNLIITSFLLYSPKGRNYSEQFMAQGTAYNTIIQSPAHLMTDVAASPQLERYDTAHTRFTASLPNSNILQGTNAIPFYYSSANSLVNDYFNELYLNVIAEHYYGNLDKRSYMDALSGCRYVAVPKTAGNTSIPYGFDELIASDDNYNLYYSDSSLPFSYVYDSYIPRADYEKMTVTQKQQALLEGAVVEEETSLPKTETSFTDETLPYEIADTQGITITRKGFHVTERGATVTLRFSGLPDSENYLIFEDLYCERTKDRENIHITISSDIGTTGLNYKTPKAAGYAGKHNRLCNLGYSENALTQITLTFNARGRYTFSDMRIVCQPMADFENYTAARRENTLSNVEINGNTVTGEIANDEEQLLCITIPYSSGWTAYLDGEKTDILQTNTLYSGIFLPPGRHQLRMVYCTPCLRGSMILAALCLTAALALGIKTYYNKNKFKKGV